jgi:hypothetical protein
MRKPMLSKTELRAQLEVALPNYRGPITQCPPAPPPEPDVEKIDLDDDETDDDTLPVLGRE